MDVDGLVDALDKRVRREGRGLLLLLDPLEELVALEHESAAESRAFFVELLVRLGEAAPEGVKVLGAARRQQWVETRATAGSVERGLQARKHAPLQCNERFRDHQAQH